jgi:RNA polymerase sigma-70 factor (ECF subfamily)
MNPSDKFDQIVREFYEPLFRFAMSLTRTQADAQDLTQHTFYIWATKGHQLRDSSKVKTWLFTTLHRAFLEFRRKRGRFTEQELDEVADDLPEISGTHAGGLEASEVLVALSRVDAVYQAAVALFYLKDCSYADIALILDIPLGTVKSRVARGIMQLRKIFSVAIVSDARVREADIRDSSVACARVPSSRPEAETGRPDQQPANRLASVLGPKHANEAESDNDSRWDPGSTLAWEQTAAFSL